MEELGYMLNEQGHNKHLTCIWEYHGRLSLLLHLEGTNRCTSIFWRKVLGPFLIHIVC